MLRLASAQCECLLLAEKVARLRFPALGVALNRLSS